MWLHSFGLIYIKWFASSTYGFSFRINEFEWKKFDVREFVSVLIKVPRSCFVWLYDALQTCHVARVLFVRCILLENLECFCIFGIGSCRWGFWMHMWLFAWYGVLGPCFWMHMMTDHREWRSGFYIFFLVSFLDSWRACLCLCIFLLLL